MFGIMAMHTTHDDPFENVPLEKLIRLLPVIGASGFKGEEYAAWNRPVWEVALWHAQMWD